MPKQTMVAATCVVKLSIPCGEIASTIQVIDPTTKLAMIINAHGLSPNIINAAIVATVDISMIAKLPSKER